MSLNKILLEQIKEHILENPFSIDMDIGLNACATVGCIAGTAIKLGAPSLLQDKRVMRLKGSAVKKGFQVYYWDDIEDEAIILLGLNKYDGTPNLFFQHKWEPSIALEYESIITRTPLEECTLEEMTDGDQHLRVEQLTDEERISLAKVVAKAIDYYIDHPDELYTEPFFNKWPTLV